MENNEIYEEVNKALESNRVFDEFSEKFFEPLNKSIEANHPLLISGDQGIGKTFAVKYFAVKNNYNITSINASNDLRIKEKAEEILRSALLKKQKKIRIVLIDEVEKGSSLDVLSSYISANKKTAYKTKNIFVCITNHYWTLGKFTSLFGSFHHRGIAPYKTTIKKYMRKEKIDTVKKDVERDLRFLQTVLETKEINKGSISDNTFEAINNFCSSSFEDRDIYKTFSNLSAPLWKWIIYNFIYGTFKFRATDFMVTVKHNSIWFHNALKVASESDMYKNYKMLEFILPENLNQTNLTHPSTLERSIKY